MQKGCHTCFSFAYVVLIYTALKKSFVAQPFINLFGQNLDQSTRKLNKSKPAYQGFNNETLYIGKFKLGEKNETE